MVAEETRSSARLVAIACVLLSAPCAAGSTALCDQFISHELRIHGVLLPDTPASPAVRRAVCAASGVEQAQIGDPDATISEMMGRYEMLKESIAMSRLIRYCADRQIALEAIQYSLYPKLDTARYWYLRTQTDHLALVDLGAQTSTFHDPDGIPDAEKMSRGLYGQTTFRIRRRDYTNHDGAVTFTDAAVTPEVLNFYSEEKQGRVGRDHLLSEGRICRTSPSNVCRGNVQMRSDRLSKAFRCIPASRVCFTCRPPFSVLRHSRCSIPAFCLRRSGATCAQSMARNQHFTSMAAAEFNRATLLHFYWAQSASATDSTCRRPS